MEKNKVKWDINENIVRINVNTGKKLEKKGIEARKKLSEVKLQT